MAQQSKGSESAFSLTCNLRNKRNVPKSFWELPFLKLKNEILGKPYELSLVIVGKDKIKSLNKKYRQIEKATDVLAFSVAPNMGEIFICPEIAHKKSAQFEKSFEEYLLFLVIHANLHLKGMQHGSKMEKYEFAYYSRYRRRYL